MFRKPSILLMCASLVAACSKSPISPSPSASRGAEGIDAIAAKPPSSRPATALFRCPGAACAGTDHILGDIPDVAYGAADGASVDSEFYFPLYAGSRRIVLDFQDVLAPCTGTCLRTFTTIAVGQDESAVFHTNTLDPSTGQLAANGILSIPVGQTWPSRLKIAFNTKDAAGNTLAWAVRYNPTDYPPSTPLHITRTATNMWVIEPLADDVAMLARQFYPKHGQPVQLNEGLYRMTFRLTVQAQ